MNLEDLDEEELDRIRSNYEQLAERARGELKRRKPARARRGKTPGEPAEG